MSSRDRVSVNVVYWNDDLRRTAGKSWMQVAETRAKWRAIGEIYV
jgi:hypothetical protein